MKIKKNYSLFIYLIFFSFLVLFTSCDKMVSAIQEEFDSERLRKAQIHPTALSQLSSPKDPILYLKYSDVFIMQSDAFTISPVANQLNTYKLEIKTAPSILNFGGKEKILLKTINNYVFINRWAEGSFNLGGFVLYDESDSIDATSYLNVILFSPELNIDTNTFSFLFKPEGAVQMSFLLRNFRNCMLLIYSEEENF